MLPTLTNGQDVLSFNCAYLVKKPKIGDIVVVKIGNREIIKRVSKFLDREKMIIIEGDNREESSDSRDFGPVGMENVVGKVTYIVGHPRSNRGSIDSRLRGNGIPCPSCDSPVIGIYGRKDAICSNCGFKLACCGEP